MSETISIGNEIKDGFEETTKWIQNNIKWLSSLESFYKERAKLEKEYGEKLSQLTKEYFAKKSAETVALSVGNSPTTTPGSLEAASQVTWNEVLSQTEFIAQDHDKFANALSFHVCGQLRTLSSRCSNILMSVERLNGEVSQRKSSSFDALDKSKKKYYESCQTMESTRSKHSGSGSEKAQKKILEKEQEMNICKNDYIIKINQANRVKDKYYFQDVPEILDILQDLNESRVGMLNVIWTKAGELERACHKAVDSRLDAADSVIAKNKPHLDSSMFIKHNIKAWKEPKDFLYEPSSVWHDDEHIVGKSQAELNDLKLRLAKAEQQLNQFHRQVDADKSNLAKINASKNSMKGQDSYDPMKFQDVLKSYIASVSGFSAIDHKKLESEVEVETIQNNVTDDSVLDTSEVDLSKREKKSGLLGKFKRNMNLSSSHTNANTGLANDNESVFSQETGKSKASNRFSLFKKSHKPKRQESGGIDNEDSGSLASHSDSLGSSRQYSQSNTVANHSEPRAKILYTYTKSDEDEVSVGADSTVAVINKDAGNGWSLVRLDTGEQGLVPQAYLELQKSSNSAARPAPPKAPQPRKAASKYMTASYPYQSQGQDELSINPGDQIRVINKDTGNGWTFGELNGVQGLFPTSYCS